VGHDHSAAAVTTAAKLIHGITASLLACKIRECKEFEFHLPIRNTVIEKLKVTLPEVSNNLHQDLAIA